MLVLGIETASERGSVALVSDQDVLLELSHDTPNAHAEQLIVLVSQLFAQTTKSSADVSRVAVGIGPGSFTGLRVGIALAQGIALGLGVPLFGIPSLRSMACAAARAEPGTGLYCPVLDARRGEVFTAAFDAELREVLAVTTLPSEGAAAQISRLLDGRPHRLCGDFARQLTPDNYVDRPGSVQFPSATACAELARPLPDSAAGDVVPLYVRPPDAILPQLHPNPLHPQE